MKLPIGISDFRKLRQGDFHYVDKSLAIAEMLDRGHETLLITRPRRFGKTINLSMMRYFFESGPEEREALFGHLNIAETRHMDHPKSPVIYLSLKDVKQDNYPAFLTEMGIQMSRLYLKYEYLKDSLSPLQKSRFDLIATQQADPVQLQDSLFQLCEWLYQCHKRAVLIFMDEYDTPIHEAWTHDYYPKTIGFMRTWLGKALKDNPNLDRAVLTGILRVAKESIFSGLNNLRVCTLLDRPFADKFGFTEDEVRTLLERLDKQDTLPVVRDWYNGYRVGETTIYNPWSVINFADSDNPAPAPYWINTSSNSLIRDRLMKAPSSVQAQVERLLQGEALQAVVNQNTSFRDMEHDEDALWGLLLFSGYLKEHSRSENPEDPYLNLTLPNKEVAEFIAPFSNTGCEPT